MMQSLIRSSSNQYLILDLEGRCHYSTVNDEKEEEFIQSLQKRAWKMPHFLQAFFLYHTGKPAVFRPLQPG